MKFDVGDIVATIFQGKLIGYHYLIVDDYSADYWYTLILEQSKYTIYRKDNMEQLCQRIA